MLWFHMAAAAYDIFLSHAWADGERPQQLAEALIQAGLRVWIDAKEIKDFSSITEAVTTKLAQVEDAAGLLLEDLSAAPRLPMGADGCVSRRAE